LADRVSRKRIILVSQVFSAVTSLALALVSWKHLSIPQIAPLREGNRTLAAVAGVFERHHPMFHFDDASVPLIYLLLFIGASARTFSWAARSSFFPTLISRDAFANAVTWNNSVFQIGSVVGPALSGLLVAYVGFPFVYLLDALCAFAFFLLVFPISRSKQMRDHTEANTWRSLVAGLRFVFGRKVILATITLDLFAVLLGGATALMPIFADQILHCGPVGLGWMRAMPAIGAFVMALLIAHLPPMKRAGKALFWCVTGFGFATILFGLSKVFWLSLGLLCLVGAFDSVSVIIRGSIVQLVTPDEMRGRVSSVNNIFIGTSNEFGALESGLTAALFGPVISVVAVLDSLVPTRSASGLPVYVAQRPLAPFCETRRRLPQALERPVQRNRPVRSAAVLVIAHFGTVEIKISVWLVADLTGERDDRRDLPIKTSTSPNLAVRDNCVVQAWNAVSISKPIVHTESRVPNDCPCIQRYIPGEFVLQARRR
jgi:MFS family permease